MKTGLFSKALILVALIPCLSATSQAKSHAGSQTPDLEFATYCLSYDQEKKASILIKGIRELGGRYSQCPVYVVVHDTTRYGFKALRQDNVILVQLTLPPDILNYPFAFKAFAAGKVEELITANGTEPDHSPATLAWFDPEALILAPPEDLDLGNRYQAALRPVYLFNGVGIKSDTVAGLYWGPVLKAAGVREDQLRGMNTEVDEVPVKSYFNCGIFSVNPYLGICRTWASVLREMIKDKTYQQTACTSQTRQIFLHQIVFSAVVVLKVNPDKIHRLPMNCGYPMELHNRIPDRKKISPESDPVYSRPSRPSGRHCLLERRPGYPGDRAGSVCGIYPVPRPSCSVLRPPE
jgi:hypothetical protein